VYTATATNGVCSSTVTTSVTSYPIPGTITGTSSICAGTTASFTAPEYVGIWMSSNTAVASIDPAGTVVGISAGTSIISYAIGGGVCVVEKSISVNPIPSSPSITPAIGNVCSGSATLLVASIDDVAVEYASTGSVSIPIPDNTPSGAVATLTFSGFPADSVISSITATINLTHTYTGDLTINLTAPNGNTINLFNANGGSSDNMINTVVSSESENPFPAVGGPYTGTYAATAEVGVGATDYLSNTSSFNSLFSMLNGTWTLSVRDKYNIDIGTIDRFDLAIAYTPAHSITWSEVAGLYIDPELTDPLNVSEPSDAVYASMAAGATPVTQVYTVTNTIEGCAASNTVEVVFYPPESPIDIVGSDTVVAGNIVPLTSTGTGGTWSSSNTAIATVDPGSGVVAGVSGGIVTIHYNKACGSLASHNMTVLGPCTPIYATPSTSCSAFQMVIYDFTLPGELGTSITDIGTGCDGTGYQNRIGIVPAPTLLAGDSYTATLVTGSLNNVLAQAWIDFNDNRSLEAGEAIGGIALPALGSFTFAATIPETASTGLHLMRVRIARAASSLPFPDLEPCADLNYGEAHDYSVFIVGAAKPGGQVTESVGSNVSFTVAPNPTTGDLTINTGVAGELAVYTIDGRELKRYEVANGSSVVAMPSGIASGVYMLRFKGDDGSTKMMRIVYQP
jgi:subtilisin-like proprotein convertase family protein